MGTSQEQLLYAQPTSSDDDDKPLRKEAPDLHEVREAQELAYWTGRYVSLSDKLLNEGEGDDIPDPGMKDGDKVMQAQEERRAQRIFLLLNECCKSHEARESLLVSHSARSVAHKSR